MPLCNDCTISLFMATIARIGKWRVMMNPREREHNPPHVHLIGGGDRLVVYLDGGCEGSARAIREAAEAISWVEEHRGELKAMWGEQ